MPKRRKKKIDTNVSEDALRLIHQSADTHANTCIPLLQSLIATGKYGPDNFSAAVDLALDITEDLTEESLFRAFSDYHDSGIDGDELGGTQRRN